ncbi:MAG TPA: hypothetical protein VGY56_13520 [Verrucomicrobiae bacterium]|nr:hypothetical protein [Verrucomicrobiae bacterium]
MREPLNLQRSDSTDCPRCHQLGRAVSAVTIEAMLIAEAKARLTQTDGFHFCATPECDVAYFHPASREVFLQRDVRVPVFQKSTNPNRLVCYCFGHTVAEIRAEFRAKGSSWIREDIKTKCAQGLDACERNNPQGSCCLGNVQRVIREAGAGNVPPDPGSSGCCCGG